MTSKKEKSDEESNPFIVASSLWQNALKGWMDTYNEFFAVSSKMTEYWLNLFWSSWLKEHKRNNDNK